MRRLLSVDALLALLALELVVVIVSGGASLLSFWQPSVSLDGFVARLVLVAVAAAWRFGRGPQGRTRLPWLVLAALLLPTLAHFHLGGGRLGGDGVMYYVYLRSWLKDGDVDLTNEYTHYGLIDRVDLRVPTRTGLRRSIFSVGPAVVLTPFFALGEAIGRVQRLAGGAPDLSGYGPLHVNATAFGSLLYGFGALGLIHATLRHHFRVKTALVATVLVWGATFLYWYMVEQPLTSHAPSACAAALGIFLWDRDRGRRTALGHAWLGLVFGLGMCIRWQNGLLLLLPGIELLRAAVARGWTGRREWVASALALAGGTLLGVWPQLLTWKALYGEWLLRYPPHGADFLRLGHPFVFETLFSSRHGLLSWTPVFWAGYLGCFALLRRRPQLGFSLLPALLSMTYVNFCSGDWWAGGSFSNRRFDSQLPIFAFGFATAIDWSSGVLRRRPLKAVALCLMPVVVWNAALMTQVRRGLVPRDDTVLFPILAGNAASVVSDAVGFPLTWPASWFFAARHHVSPGRYDLAVGRYLFYRQNNLGGRLDVAGAPDDGLLAEGWGRLVARPGGRGRLVRGRARVLAPLDVPEDLVLRVRAASFSDVIPVDIEVNGYRVGTLRVGATVEDQTLPVGAAWWRSGLNDVVVDARGAELAVDSFQFERQP